MTPSFDPAHPSTTDGLFRPADHVLVVPEGSAMAILDLERGVIYATTPLGAHLWSRMVADTKPSHRAVAIGNSWPIEDEDRHSWARSIGYLFDRRIIEPITR